MLYNGSVNHEQQEQQEQQRLAHLRQFIRSRATAALLLLPPLLALPLLGVISDSGAARWVIGLFWLVLASGFVLLVTQVIRRIRREADEEYQRLQAQAHQTEE